MLVRLLIVRFLMIVACLGLSAPLMAQTGHPAKGSWSGDLTPASGAPTHMRLLVNAKNGELTGSINPGRDAVTMKSVVLTAESWALAIHAPMKEGELVLTGILSNIGSWTNRKYIGTYSLGSTKGKFEFTLN